MNLLADPLCKRYTVTLLTFEKLFSFQKVFLSQKFLMKKNEVSIVCKFWISGFYFTPLKRVLFTFPSRYLFTIGQRRIFRLWGWSPNLQARKFALLFFSRKKIVIQGFHLLWQDFSIFSEFFFFLKLSPWRISSWQVYAFSGFARHYYQNLGWFVILWLLRCFNSPSFMSLKGFPLGNLWITKCFVFPHSVSSRFTSNLFFA